MARTILFVLGIMVALLVGAFIVIGALLPSEREFRSEHDLCYEAGAVHRALSEPELIVEWLFTVELEPEAYDDHVRWQDGDRWIELRIIESVPPTAVDYEFKQQGRFTLPIQARLEGASERDEGSHLTMVGQGSARTPWGRWFLVAPDILAWLRLPHQSFEEALELMVGRLESHLEETMGEC